MSRFLLTILLLFLSFSFIAQTALVNINNPNQTIFLDEETKSENGNDNKKLDSAKDKIFLLYSSVEQCNFQISSLPAAFEYFNISKGFADTPYTPPDLS